MILLPNNKRRNLATELKWYVKKAIIFIKAFRCTKYGTAHKQYKIS